MANTLSELKEKAATLSVSERAELALALIESLDGRADDAVEEAWLAETERRLQEIESGSVEPIPGDEVFRRLRERHG